MTLKDNCPGSTEKDLSLSHSHCPKPQKVIKAIKYDRMFSNV